MMEADVDEVDKDVGGGFLAFFGGGGWKEAGQRKMVEEDEGETGSQETDNWVEGGDGASDGETTCGPVSDSTLPPFDSALFLSLSLSVLVSREDEFSGRLSSRAGFRGCSALHYATLADDPHLVRILLEAGRFLISGSAPISLTPLQTLNYNCASMLIP